MPNEDEFATAAASLCSPYMMWAFPRAAGSYERFLTFRGVPDGGGRALEGGLPPVPEEADDPVRPPAAAEVAAAHRAGPAPAGDVPRRPVRPRPPRPVHRLPVDPPPQRRADPLAPVPDARPVRPRRRRDPPLPADARRLFRRARPDPRRATSTSSPSTTWSATPSARSARPTRRSASAASTTVLPRLEDHVAGLADYRKNTYPELADRPQGPPPHRVAAVVRGVGLPDGLTGPTRPIRPASALEQRPPARDAERPGVDHVLVRRLVRAGRPGNSRGRPWRRPRRGTACRRPATASTDCE